MLKKWALIVGLISSFPKFAFALDAAKEYEIKSAFLYNLGSFVTWSDASFVSRKEPTFRICVFGDDPFGERLDVVVNGQKISGRAIELHRFKEITQSKHCELLFISQSEQSYIQDIFSFLKKMPILTVSDMDNFVVQGGMIQFIQRDNKIRLLINPEILQESDLKPSSQLMKIAQIFTKGN
jgi:hypothetical protein